MSLRTRLVLALLAGPAAAAVGLLVLYILVYRAQQTGTKLSLHVATLVALLVAAAGTIYAWRVKRRETRARTRAPPTAIPWPVPTRLQSRIVPLA